MLRSFQPPRWNARRALQASCITGAFVAVLGRGTSSACEGPACIRIWSTAPGGGALTLQYDFTKKVQTLLNLCKPGNSVCFYSNVDPGFMAPPTDDDPSNSFYVLADGTTVRLVIVALDAALSLGIGQQQLSQPGNTVVLGTMPAIHNHPTWQLTAPGNQFGDFTISYKLTTDSPAYTESAVFTSIVTNVPPPPVSPTPTVPPIPTPTTIPCPGDCDGDGSAAVNEVMLCMTVALGAAGELACSPCDGNGDGTIAVDEIVAAVDAALNGCPMPPSATLQTIQDMIFTPRCATAGCHNAGSAADNLVLSAGASYSQLVGVHASSSALLRVDPGHPDTSFLLIKVAGPPVGQGERMPPPTQPPLRADQIQLIRDWILQGAQP